MKINANFNFNNFLLHMKFVLQELFHSPRAFTATLRN